DYDAIIMGHSQFEKIPISRERQERLLQEQIDEITEGIAEVKYSGGERFTVKQLERTKKSLEARLEKLQAESRKDDVVTCEQLGVDCLFVDEAHNYKNLFLYTKMRNVAGLSTSDAQKSSDNKSGLHHAGRFFFGKEVSLMATTRIMPLHIGKGRTESRAISDIIDYVANPQKTDNGKLITSYG